MAEVPEGYHEVPPEDRTKARVFFDRGRTVAGTGNFEYAIEMYIQGLTLDPDAVDAHTELREISLKRKASGGKSIGFTEGFRLKRPTKDDKLNMLNAEKLLAYDPGNTDFMVSIIQNAHRGGYFDTVMWVGPILQKANADDRKPDFNKFIVLRDIYKSLKEWKLATDATQYATRLRPLDMDLQSELKNLGAMETMTGGGYSKRGSFRDSIRDMTKQTLLQKGDQDTHDLDAQTLLIRDAEAQYKAEPNDPGKAMRLVDALEKAEQPDFENRAVELLQEWFDKTKQFRYRQRIGQIYMKQMARMERGKRAAVNETPNDAEVLREYREFKKEQDEFELKEYKLASEAYPTDARLLYEVGVRMFRLERFGEAVPIFQQARNDPKYRVDAGVYLGLSFLQAGFVDEADETLAGMIKDYPVQGDDRSKRMHYWRGRALELKELKGEALSLFSKVAQMDFNYLDVQARIKKLKSEGTTRS